MNGAVALSSGYETKWTVVSGPMKGAVRVLNHSFFTIGRSPECEFAIGGDPKCSRRHAEIRLTPQGYQVVSLSDKNPVVVNGDEVESAYINDGDMLIFGDTEVQFNIIPALAIEQVPQSPAISHPSPPSNYGVAIPEGGARPKRNTKPKSSNRRFLIYGVIGLVLFWLFGTNSNKKKNEIQIRTEQQMNAEIESANKIREQKETENSERMDPSITARQAQENYVRGFRDYRKGQYERSVESFQACLALNPNHILCNRYLRLSQRKFNEMVQYYVLLGRKYRDQNQFQSCRAAFRNVMVMVKDANNETYKLAKANYEACNASLEGRF